MICGHVSAHWNDQDLDNLLIKPHHQIYRGFDLVDEQDRSRYELRVTHDVYRDLPPFIDKTIIEQSFSWLDKKSYAVHRMSPGTLLPMHKDRYRYYSQANGILDTKNIIRVIVFLKSWRNGHYLEIDSTPIINWQAGDWVSWRDDAAHLAANLGHESRYTLQITGVDIS